MCFTCTYQLINQEDNKSQIGGIFRGQDSVTDRLFTFVVVLSHRIMNDHTVATQNEIMTQRFRFE